MLILNENLYAKSFWISTFKSVGYALCDLRDVGAAGEDCFQMDLDRCNPTFHEAYSI